MSLTALLVFPVILAMTLGAAALLAAVGDATAAAACRWVALGLGIIWCGSVVATAALAAFVALDHRDRPPRRLRRRLRRAEAGGDQSS